MAEVTRTLAEQMAAGGVARVRVDAALRVHPWPGVGDPDLVTQPGPDYAVMLDLATAGGGSFHQPLI